MRGEAVVVETHRTVGSDAYGSPIAEPSLEEVADVLVSPGALADLGEDRPEGVRIRYTLYFPKGYEGDLEGARVNVRGRWLYVIGRPDRYLQAPTRWDMQVDVGDSDG